MRKEFESNFRTVFQRQWQKFFKRNCCRSPQRNNWRKFPKILKECVKQFPKTISKEFPKNPERKTTEFLPRNYQKISKIWPFFKGIVCRKMNSQESSEVSSKCAVTNDFHKNLSLKFPKKFTKKFSKKFIAIAGEIKKKLLTEFQKALTWKSSKVLQKICLKIGIGSCKGIAEKMSKRIYEETPKCIAEQITEAITERILGKNVVNVNLC